MDIHIYGKPENMNTHCSEIHERRGG